jgi:hypothetical protein
MKPIIALLVLAAGCTTIAIGQAFTIRRAGVALAQQNTTDEGHSRSCSLASLHGTYGFSFNGTVAPFGPVAGQGTIVFTSAGNLSGSYNESVNGVLFQGKFTGSFNVNADCTGAGTVTGLSHTWTVQMHLVVVDNGKEVLLLETDPGRVVSGVAKRL